MSKYIDVKLDRLYLNYLADCRDYIWEKAKSQKKGLRFYVKNTGRWITIPYEKMDEGEMGNRVFKSKLARAKIREYRLVSFAVTKQEYKDREKEVEPQMTIDDMTRHAQRMVSIRKQLGL